MIKTKLFDFEIRSFEFVSDFEIRILTKNLIIFG